MVGIWMSFCTDPHGVDLFVQWMKERGLRAPAANQSNQCTSTYSHCIDMGGNEFLNKGHLSKGQISG